VVALVVEASRRFGATGNGKLALADISRRGGGYFWPHRSHRLGLDADFRPVRRDGRQCHAGTTWRARSYDRAGTRA
jgi:murein endopeptidase